MFYLTLPMTVTFVYEPIYCVKATYSTAIITFTAYSVSLLKLELLGIKMETNSQTLLQFHSIFL